MANRILLGPLASLISLLPLVIACSESAPSLFVDLGDPCRSAYHFCLDDDSVRACEAGVWVERDCASVCAELGPAYGPVGCDAECVCELLDPSGCTPSEASCLDDGTVAVCDEAQDLQPSPCSTVCANAGLSEIGCVDHEGIAACWCTSEGTSCEPSTTPKCVDDATIAVCESGTWTFADCQVVCGGPAECDPFRWPAACDC